MIGISVFVYVGIGTLVAAFTKGRSLLDTVLDIFLWPVIAWYYGKAFLRRLH